jgi:hypothetical protein
MTFFFFKKQKIVLDCFTSSSSVIQLTPICPAIKHIPEWWKQLPKAYYSQGDIAEKASMKTCSGFIQTYSEGIAIPLWSDLTIEVANYNYKWQFSDMSSSATVHENEQRKGFLIKDVNGHLKLESPWYFKTKKDINWVWTPATYNLQTLQDFTVLPGVLNFTKQTATNVNIIIPLEINRKFTIPLNQPLVNIYPMSECEVVIKRHLVSPQEMKTINLNSASFINTYIKAQELKKFYSDCPYKKFR